MISKVGGLPVFCAAGLVSILAIKPAGVFDSLFSIVDFVIPFFLIFCLFQYKRTSTIFLVCALLVAYLFSSELVNAGLSRMTLMLRGVRAWIYLAVFVAIAKLFCLDRFKKLLRPGPVVLIGFALWFSVLLGVVLDISIVSSFFKGESDSENRLMVPTPFFLLLALFNLNAVPEKKRAKYHLVMALTWGVFFSFNPQRQLMLIVFLSYFFLYFNFKSTKSLFLIFAFALTSFVAASFSSEYFQGRLLELFYFYNSLSFWVRVTETGVFVSQVMETALTSVVGLGAGYMAEVPRYVLDEDYDFRSGGDVFTDQIYDYHLFHSADSLVSILMVDGGLILLLSVLALVIKVFIEILKINYRFAFIYLVIFLSVSVTSVHIVTNPIFAFFMAYLYYRAQGLMLVVRGRS